MYLYILKFKYKIIYAYIITKKIFVYNNILNFKNYVYKKKNCICIQSTYINFTY
jgi:hypothetical protein